MNFHKRAIVPAMFVAAAIALGCGDASAGYGVTAVAVAPAPQPVRYVESHYYDSTGGHSIHKATQYDVVYTRAPSYGVAYTSVRPVGTVSVGYTSYAPVYNSGYSYSYSGYRYPRHVRSYSRRYYSAPRVGIHLSYGSGGHYGYGLHLSNRYGGSTHVSYRSGHHGGHRRGHHGGHHSEHDGGRHGGHDGGRHGGHH